LLNGLKKVSFSFLPLCFSGETAIINIQAQETVLGDKLDKRDFLKWSAKYDKDRGWLGQLERELGARFRKTRVMSRADLARVVEWEFSDNEAKKRRVLELVARNDEASVLRVSSQAFSLASDADACKMNCLTMLEGVSPVLASVVLSFFEPKRYGVFDVYAWRASLGNEVPNLFSTMNYLRLLAALRKTAAKHGLDVRTVEKALVKKKLDEAGVGEASLRRKNPRPLGKAKPRNKQKW
jgi:hypothetical protein